MGPVSASSREEQDEWTPCLFRAQRHSHRHSQAMVARWLFLALCVSPADAQRAIHWVIRVSSLEETLRFTSEVLGMRVLRHEENDAACPLTCNGEFDTAWSKTMVGYGAEDENYALELTYNYGVEKYERGEGLQRFIIRIPHGGAAQALARAESLGYGSHDGVVTGPDGYRYELLGEDSSDGRPEPFEMIVLRASDPSALADWYASTLGMRVVAHDHEAVTMTFDAQKDILFMIERAATPPKITQWDGRNAFALPAEAIRSIYARVKAEAPSLIVHEVPTAPIQRQRLSPAYSPPPTARPRHLACACARACV